MNTLAPKQATAAAGNTALDVRSTSSAPEFFATHMYYDRPHAIEAVKLMPGEYFVSVSDMLLATVLGSCVSACIRDVRLNIGGMNHFMLPESDAAGPATSGARYGTYAMEILINHLMKLGARRENLEAKVFGGGNVLPGLTQANIGHKNAAFVRGFLQTERIRVVASDLEDVFPRKIYYFPASGRALVKRLGSAGDDKLIVRESEYRKRINQVPSSGDVELF